MTSFSNEKINKASSFILVMKTPGSSLEKMSHNIAFNQDHKKHSYASEDNRMEVVFALRKENTAKHAQQERPGARHQGIWL